MHVAGHISTNNPTVYFQQSRFVATSTTVSYLVIWTSLPDDYAASEESISTSSHRVSEEQRGQRVNV